MSSKVNKTNENEKNDKKANSGRHSPKTSMKDKFFKMDIDDDFYDPFETDIFTFKPSHLFQSFFKDFDLLSENKIEEEPKEEELKEVKKVEPKEVKKVEPKEEKKEEPKKEKMEVEKNEEQPKREEKIEEISNNGTYFSRVYRSSYSNIDGEPKEESYHCQTIKQSKDGHDISETKEAYKNSNGVMKTAYQRNMDGKKTRFIKEKNSKTGKVNNKRFIEGVEENKIDDFHKEYNEYCKKSGFRKNFKNMNLFWPFNDEHQQISDGNKNFNHQLLF